MNSKNKRNASTLHDIFRVLEWLCSLIWYNTDKRSHIFYHVCYKISKLPHIYCFKKAAFAVRQQRKYTFVFIQRPLVANSESACGISHPLMFCVTTVIFAACQQDMCLRAPSRGSRSFTGGDCSTEPKTRTSNKALPIEENRMNHNENQWDIKYIWYTFVFQTEQCLLEWYFQKWNAKMLVS